MPTVYWAGPLFNDAERAFNESAKAALEQFGITVWLPQDIPIDFEGPGWQRVVFDTNVWHIGDADVVCAVVDGCLVDDGTAWEIGYAFAVGKPIIGIHTDIRSVGIEGTVNLMIEQTCSQLLSANWNVIANAIREARNASPDH